MQNNLSVDWLGAYFGFSTITKKKRPKVSVLMQHEPLVPQFQTKLFILVCYRRQMDCLLQATECSLFYISALVLCVCG